jgi:hypothetical protein
VLKRMIVSGFYHNYCQKTPLKALLFNQEAQFKD